MEKLETLWRESLICKFLDKIETNVKRIFQNIIEESRIFPWLDFLLEHYLYIFLFLLPFLTSGKIAILSFGAFVLWALITFLNPKEKFFKNLDTFSILLFVFLGINIYATFFSPYLLSAIKGLAKFLVYFALFFIFRDVFKHPNKQKNAIIAILLSTFLLALYCVYQWIIKVPPLAGWEDQEYIGENVTRVYGTLLNPNLLGGYLIAVFPYVLSSLFFFPYFKSFILTTIVITALSIIWTYSRGAYLGFVAEILVIFLGTFLYLWQKDKALRKRLIIIYSILLLLFIIGIFTNTYLRMRILSMFTIWGHTSNVTRIMIWKSSFKILKDFFLTGIGLGNDVFRQVYAFYMEPKYTALASYNLFLELAIEGSIFSLILFLIMLYYLYKKFFVHFSGWSFDKKLLGITAISSITAPLFHGLVDTIWYRPYPQIIFWLSCAILINLFKEEENQKVLAFNLGGLGDQILFLPTLEKLKKHFKEVKVITEKRGKEILEICGYEVYEFNPKNKLSLKETLRLLTNVRKEKFDITVSSGKSPFIPIFMYLISANIRVGYKENPLSFLYTNKASSIRNEYMGRVHYRLVKALGIKEEFEPPQIKLNSEILEKGKEILDSINLKPNEFIIIHPGISNMSIVRGIDRRWETDKWRKLIEKLEENNIEFIVTLGPDEGETEKEFRNFVKEGRIIKPKNLEEFLALIYYSKILVCLDSAPLHLGIALNKPLIALFGPTNPKEIVPEGNINFQVVMTNLPCQPCLWDRRKRVCETLDCMKGITVEEVWKRILFFIQK